MDTEVAGLAANLCGNEGEPLLLVAGPPMSRALFHHVQRRLAPRATIALELVQVPAEQASLSGLTARLQQAVDETGAVGVIAHGLAVPVALGLSVDRVYISNGPCEQLDPVTASLASLGERALSKLLLRPELALKWLASSAGLRRTVVNPYVMDHDTVVRLTEGVLGSAQTRETAAVWMRSVAGEGLGNWRVEPSHVFGIWGDSDPLYTLKQLRSALEKRGAPEPSVILGARHFHPEERPWELADRVLEQEARLIATPMS